MRFRIYVLGFQESRLGLKYSGFMVQGLVLAFLDLGFRVKFLRFRVEFAGLRVWGLSIGLMVQGSLFMV